MLVPGAKEPNNKYLYFPPTWSISICHGFLSYFLNYPSVFIFFSPISCLLSISGSVCPSLSHSIPLGLQSSIHAMTCVSQYAYGQW